METTSYTNEELDTIVEGPINLTHLANALADSLDAEFHIYDTEPSLITDRKVDDSITIEIGLDHASEMHLVNMIGRMMLHHLKVTSVKE